MHTKCGSMSLFKGQTLSRWHFDPEATSLVWKEVHLSFPAAPPWVVSHHSHLCPVLLCLSVWLVSPGVSWVLSGRDRLFVVGLHFLFRLPAPCSRWVFCSSVQLCSDVCVMDVVPHPVYRELLFGLTCLTLLHGHRFKEEDILWMFTLCGE